MLPLLLSSRKPIETTKSASDLNTTQLSLNASKSKKLKSILTNSAGIALKSKLWMDKSIPQSINEIYESCSQRLKRAQKRIDSIDESNCMDRENLFDTLNFYSHHLHELKDFIGVSEIKSHKAMKHIVDVVKSKLKTQNELLKKEKDSKKKKLLPDLYEKHKIDEFDEDYIQLEQELMSEPKSETTDVKLPALLASSSNQIKPAVKESNESFMLEKRVVTSDPIITPILVAHRNRKLIIDQANEENTDILNDLYEKIQTCIYEKYKEPIEEIDHINRIFEKYLLSFLLANSQDFLESKVRNDETELDTYNRNLIRSDILLEAPIKYDKKRIYYISFIRKSLKSLFQLRDKYNDGTYKGISVDDLSHENRTLARKFDLKDIPIVLVLTEYSIVLNKCLRVLHEWLVYDKEYFNFVTRDIKDIEKRKKNLNAIKHASDVIYNDIVHKIKQAKQAFEAHELELVETCKKNEVKMYWLNNRDPTVRLKLNPEYVNLECRAMLERLQADLVKLELEIPKLNATIDKNTFKNKQMIMEEKYKHYDALRAAFVNMENQLNYLYEEKKVKQNELDILENCHLKLKTIIMYKESSETLNKIFFDLPLPATKFALTDNKAIELLKMNIELDDEELKKKIVISKDDQFVIAINFVANLLENDWIKYYYVLPFYPERGAHNIKKDVDDVFLKFKRGDVVKEQAFYALQKWKRFHSRAKLEDLREGLKAINRVDILNQLNAHLKKLREPKVKEADKTKKSTAEIEDLKKRDVEMLHEKLTKYLERVKNSQALSDQHHHHYFQHRSLVSK